MDNESIHSESEFYLYPEEQDKENEERSGNFNILVDEESSDNNIRDEIQEVIEQQRPKNATKKTTYDLNVYGIDIVHESRKLEEIPANEVDIMNWKFLLIVRGKNKYIIHRPGSVRIGKNCALGLEKVFKTSSTVFPIQIEQGR